MKSKKIIASMILSGIILITTTVPTFADSARVVTLGANLNEVQKQTMLDYFGVKKNEVVLLEVNNQEERKYLEGIASEQQIGTRTLSCAYVEPTKKGSGIKVKTANITWVTSAMVATTLSTAGLTDANCVVASVFPVSGTGALTGIMKGFEDATGEKLDEEKKEIASEELIITGDLGNDIGQDKATGVINDIKTEIIKNDTKDTIQIADTIVNVTNNYNITISQEQKKQIEDLMGKISAQDYNYKDMKKTLTEVKKTVENNIKEAGDSIDKGFFEGIKGWFSGIADWFTGIFDNSEEELGILNNTNDNLLGEDAKIDSTDKAAIETSDNRNVFEKMWDYIKGIFTKDEGGNTDTPTKDESIENTDTIPKDESTENTDTPPKNESIENTDTLPKDENKENADTLPKDENAENTNKDVNLDEQN